MARDREPVDASLEKTANSLDRTETKEGPSFRLTRWRRREPVQPKVSREDEFFFDNRERAARNEAWVWHFRSCTEVRKGESGSWPTGSKSTSLSRVPLVGWATPFESRTLVAWASLPCNRRVWALSMTRSLAKRSLGRPGEAASGARGHEPTLQFETPEEPTKSTPNAC